ncbi:sugar ABC transporter ATP-binding protein [Actinoallomurus purpureus]|uniref:sugar ABC transporter ATP-binding protein n=1 Tax=Actinoallomurus purpureus TaxID=478114 RepID=UPI002092EC16|nr:sugar ABC transporter ATP-binding protein [Actinoallomurus purpureus]MCO6006047.1 sugar ABC transporter ATP-binding protein [Actinoallomurus purpureus]
MSVPASAAAGPRPVAAAHRIDKRFGVTVALDDVSLTVRDGDVHALVGRNGAGKSTLVSVLTGLVAPDSGSVEFDGRSAPPLADREAWRQRVACVYQKSTVIPSLSVAENLFLNRQGRGLISWGALRRRARELLETWEVDVDVQAPAARLSVEQRQLVEIARALSHGSRFIILDEPTAQLDGQAIERLFDRMRSLRESGVTFLFISHHLDEVYEVCDTVTVMRDARHIMTSPVPELGKADLITAMTGEATGLIDLGADRPTPAAGEERALTVTGLGVPGVFEDVSLSVAPGEIVGLAGAVGSGKMAVGESIVGLRRAGQGTVKIGGVTPRPGSVPAALRVGIGFVPQDRHREGLVPGLSIAENATLTVPERLGRFGFVGSRRRDELGVKAIGDLDIKAAGPEQPVSALSGGNQQKVVMARALANEPKVLVLMQPTAGVDVKAKETLLGTAAAAAVGGAGVLMISDDLDDLRPCDRVIVLFKGAVVAEMAKGWDDNELIAAMEGIGD